MSSSQSSSSSSSLPQALATSKDNGKNKTANLVSEPISCLLITANVGTIFEESTLLELWFQQLKSYLIDFEPRFVAIHCQEVGGKNYESSMKNVSIFTDKILGDQDIIGQYSRVRIFLDDNFECLEKFTALGSLYLIHDSVPDVKLYNFKTAQNDSIQNRIIFKDNNNNNSNNSNSNRVSRSRSTPTSNFNAASSNQQDQTDKSYPTNTGKNENNNNIDVSKASPTADMVSNQAGSCEHVEKVKFPQDLFPECRWSRKGFMRTRWLFNDSQSMDLVNIHLFHDASNLVAMEKTPSPYAQNRQKALEFALKRISMPLKGQNRKEVPLFIFGDFNFRLDTNKVIQRITEGVPPIIRRKSDSDEVVEFIYHRKTSDCNFSPLTTSSKSSSSSSSIAPTVANQYNSLGVAINEQKITHTITTELRCKNDASTENETNGASNNENVVMTIGKKLFDCKGLDEMFHATKNTEWLQELDNELNSFRNELHEFKISFSPSYPFKEDESGGYSYMKTRCPAWCDRILFNSAASRIISCHAVESNDSIQEDMLNIERRSESIQNNGAVIYRLLGNEVPMGDHKPVMLYCRLNLTSSPEVSAASASE